MQHLPATIEEQLILKSIKEECPWENLPKRLQATLFTKEEWHRRIIDYCIRRRLQWNTSFARKVCKEGEYYEDLMRHLRKNLALFPYHLAEYVCRVMRVSPFKYYCDMLFEVMRNEQPYDSIPNFSAADALRLTGIGRNEFIDIMNKCRSKGQVLSLDSIKRLHDFAYEDIQKIMWKLNKSIAKELLPTQPVDLSIEPWWGVCLVNFTLEEFKKLTEEETGAIDKICKEEANSFVLFDPDIIKGLYKRGLVYFEVPVYPDDRFKVSRLEGFVSNREQSYEDPIEELLYAVFVVSSENATVAEMAATLQADLSQLQAAASFSCRLGWAVKLIDPDSILQDSSIPGSPSNILSDDEDGSNASINSEKSAQQAHGGLEKPRPISSTAHVALVVDANITSYLMMGSLSPGLKSHAVTLYEAGKLGDSTIAELCQDLASLEGKKFEGELQDFANHAFSLRCVLECLQSGGIATSEVTGKAGAEINVEPSLVDEILSLTNEINIDEGSGHSDTNEANILHNDGSDEITAITHTELPQFDYSHSESDVSKGPFSLSNTSSENKASILDNDIEIDQNTVLLDGQAAEKTISKRKRKYRVDILRCESLAALAPATLERLFLRDYDIIVSMVPLPSLSVLPGPSGPIHFGPPSYSSMTPWMKLVLYTALTCGPLSIVLMKGQRLRLLPAPLAGCEKALIWSWDGSVIGGLGGKFEGNLVKGNLLLHCLNSVTRHSALLVQPLSKYDLDVFGRIVTMDVPLPLKNSDGSVAPVGSEMSLSTEEISNLTALLNSLSNKIDLLTVGYIRLLRLHRPTESDVLLDNVKYEWVPLSLEFGVPLFSPKLCRRICERVSSSHLLQADSLTDHHDAMQSLRRRLHDICTEYQATGPTAKLFYQREYVKESPRQLINYVSGRWSPLLDPATPISGSSSEHQKLKLARQQRGRTEVLSFDGNILRSYALSPVYEASTRAIEESTPTNATKSESEDVDSKDVVLPGINLLFDGAELHPFDIGACLQARQPIALIAEASAASASLQTMRTS